jgi:hypothetical protein
VVDEADGVDVAAVARHRRHRPAGRGRRIRYKPTYDEAENELIVAAAAAAGLTPTGYVAAAALAAAANTRPPLHSPLRDALAEVGNLATQLRRTGGNLNQAVAQLQATGAPPVWLQDAVRLTVRAVGRVDAVCDRLYRLLA